MRDRDRPAVLIVGGFATIPPNYLPFRHRLLRAGAARVDICPIWTPDWLLAGIFGFGAVMGRTRRAIVNAYRANGRRPIIVIGHSAGGIAARLAMSPVPFNGARAGVSQAVGCLVTLGTPHGLAALTNQYQHAGHQAAAFLMRETPGAFFAPRTSYVTVAGLLDGRAGPAAPGGRIGNELFRILVGDETAAEGDGIVPAAAALLDGARQIVLPGVRHGMLGAPWYGDAEVIAQWWPAALDDWKSALRMREPAEALELEVAGWSSGSSSGS
jgi:PGAP1-like protein